MFKGNPISSWNEIIKLGESFPQLESLVIAECPIKSLDFNGKNKEEMIHNLDSNEENGEEKDNDDDDDNNINYKRTESECEALQKNISAHHWFRHLKILNMNYTLLNSWDDVDRLGKFPQLNCLRIQGCPLFEVKIFLFFYFPLFFIIQKKIIHPFFVLTL